MKLFHFIIAVVSLLFIGLACCLGQDSSEFSTLSEWEEKLFTAADEGDTVAVLQLIDLGVNVNTTSYEGVTPLMYAAQNGNTAMVKLLISHGARVDLKPVNGYTALISAIRSGYLGTAEFLIRNGADIDLPDNSNVTPLMHAIAVDSFYMPDMLLYYNASVDKRNKQGMNALMLASWLGRYEIVLSLLEAGADVNTADGQSWTPLHYATLAGKLDIMDLLIVNGANLEAATNSGYTPLSLAIAKNNYGAAKLLTGYGADVNSRITPSLNPLTLALENKNDSLVNMLRNQEAKVIRKPYFNRVTFGTLVRFNTEDTHLGFSIGLSEKKYNLMTSLGYGFRLKAIQVLEQTSETEYYQFWEKRHFISLSCEKAVFIPGNTDFMKSGIFAGFSEVLTFGGYRGSKENPDIRLVFNPRIGIIFEFRLLRFKVDYEFMDLRLEDIPNGWFNVSMDLMFTRKRAKLRVPSMNWF
jgi:ankyrin repeat protein